MYPFDNNIPKYPFDNNKYVDSSELVDFNATPSVDRMKELDTQIAELKQKIAQKKAAALQSKYDRMNDPDYRVARYDYIVSGDRSGLDRISEAERAYKNMLANQAHAKELAEAQRKEAYNYEMDEFIKNRANAENAFTYAVQELRKAKASNNVLDIALATKNYNDAKANLEYWDKRTGKQSVITDLFKDLEQEEQKAESKSVEPVKNDNPLGGFNVDTFVKDLEAIEDFETNADKAKKLKQIEAIKDWKQNTALVEQWNRLNKIISKAQRKANADDKLAKLQKEFDEIKSPFQRTKWLSSHSNVIAKGNKLQYKK